MTSDAEVRAKWPKNDGESGHGLRQRLHPVSGSFARTVGRPRRSVGGTQHWRQLQLPRVVSAMCLTSAILNKREKGL